MISAFGETSMDGNYDEYICFTNSVVCQDFNKTHQNNKHLMW